MVAVGACVALLSVVRLFAALFRLSSLFCLLLPFSSRFASPSPLASPLPSVLSPFLALLAFPFPLSPPVSLLLLCPVRLSFLPFLLNRVALQSGLSRVAEQSESIAGELIRCSPMRPLTADRHPRSTFFLADLRH